MHRTTWVCLVVCVGLGGACADDDDDHTVDAGADTSMSEGGSGGDGPTAGRGATDCRSQRSLAEYCEPPNCPRSPEAVLGRICMNTEPAFLSYHVEPNECGGTTVHHLIGNSSMRYHFDTSGALIGVTSVDDVPAPGCDDIAIRYGRTCTNLTPRPRTRCASEDAGAEDAG
jgi:hypothetical protein